MAFRRIWMYFFIWMLLPLSIYGQDSQFASLPSLFFLPFMPEGINPVKPYIMHPLSPSDVLTDEEIQRLFATRDFFEYTTKFMPGECVPIWKGNKRKYSANFYAQNGVHRNLYLSMDDAIHRILTDGFPIQYQIKALYQANMGVHSGVGNIVPKLNLAFGQGLSGVDTQTLFSGLFGFLLPSNWLNLANQVIGYDIAKALMMKIVLDEILSVKTAYIAQHQLIQDLEIINFYLIHFQLLMEQFPEDTILVQNMKAAYAYIGSFLMSPKRAAVRNGFNALANAVALEKLGGLYTIQTMNIRDIEDFPFEVKDPRSDEEDFYAYKELFLEEVIRRSGESLELRVVNDLYTISKNNIGITATGGTLATIENNSKPQFAVSLGYGTLPAVLTANSLSGTAYIDVKKQYLSMLNSARQAYDSCISTFEEYVEIKRGLEETRKAFLLNLQPVLGTHLEPGVEPSFLLLSTLNYLLYNELLLNQVLHTSMTARATMDRFLLKEQKQALRYLPQKDEIMKLFRDAAKETGYKELDALSEEFMSVHSSKKLNSILNHHRSSPEWKHYTQEEIKQSVHDNIGNLLYKDMWRLPKSPKFFKILQKYIDQEQLELTTEETYQLQRKTRPWWKQLRRGEHINKKDFIHNRDFKNFTVIDLDSSFDRQDSTSSSLSGEGSEEIVEGMSEALGPIFNDRHTYEEPDLMMSYDL